MSVKDSKKPLFVFVKCQLGMTFSVAEAIIDTIEETYEVYSIAGKFDLLVKFRIPLELSIGHFINDKVQQIKGVIETETLIVFSAFVGSINDDAVRLAE